VISVGALTPILVCSDKLEITPPSNFNQSCDGTRGLEPTVCHAGRARDSNRSSTK
jgi:hypothetical protein